ncbi:hypothetical protein [Sphingobacterium griseoflavum]|uniref:Uncharacterized protein n=1 Tax=Sphingobacterium griseoflavum TaxID=1474952 RepID=A0ABQ3HT07_9SPHI|nr:hypothetical protein [Sphingobacterium griseoflavum]GHE23581.1 hypothetical protein GCM10017764_05490 [Sphingobacterium griseoflavum]
MKHGFHIPVLGLAFSVDTPLKVAKFGINSVVSIVDDELIERMRLFYLEKNNIQGQPIQKKDGDYRAKRITAYLNLLKQLVEADVRAMEDSAFLPGSDLNKYFDLLPHSSPDKKIYLEMSKMEPGKERDVLSHKLKSAIQAGDIDVNIMSKVDKINFDTKGVTLEDKHSDALAALRGFAYSTLRSSVVLSAGMNPRLYQYIAELSAFLPNDVGELEKKITLKVSDFRSAYIQAKYLVKKGIWVSEFRIESGLNCGGHAFATDGYLLGPILEEFKQKRQELLQELSGIYKSALLQKGYLQVPDFTIRFTVQGGIGTAQEQSFLLTYYGFDSVGWGSPFLLVPEATTVDDETLNHLIHSEREDFYLSNASPLGVPFRNFKKSTAEQERLERIRKGRPGSPCTKKYLISNTEFSETPICTAARAYQHAKIKELETQQLSVEAFRAAYHKITEKACLCDGLAAAAYLKYGISKPKESTAVAICPGPNTAFFQETYSLQQMVDHIYGRAPIALSDRPHFFINELQLYVDYLRNYIQDIAQDDRKVKFAEKFKVQLLDGISYYRTLGKLFGKLNVFDLPAFLSGLTTCEEQLLKLQH